VSVVIQGVSVAISDGSTANTTPVDTFQTTALDANTPDA
jgi:hypothetical protein